MGAIHVTGELLDKYNTTAPRYTSYPPIPFWGEATHDQVVPWMGAPETPLAAQKPVHDSLSLYTHIPFCESRCYYCGCFVVITPHHEQSLRYEDAVVREMELAASHMARPLPVRQYHLGGGTPNYLQPDRMRHLVAQARRIFPFLPEAEMSIEVDPRTLSDGYLEMLRELGFNRISFGVQDFDPQVQKTVNRIQPYEMVAHVTQKARELGFLSVNFDLIYGLPAQNLASFHHTMEQVGTLKPDRVALYNYAHLPHSHPYQRRFTPETLPSTPEKLGIFLAARDAFLSWGYEPIGLDHFARPDEDLARAVRARTMQRNFMGYTTQAGSDMLAFGISAISDYNDAFWQNEKKLSDYYRAIAAGRLPISRGMKLSDDDRRRKAIIQALFCESGFDYAAMGAALGVDFKATYARELGALEAAAADGLVELTPARLEVTALGQLFLRNVAVVFDAYLRDGKKPPVEFSRTA